MTFRSTRALALLIPLVMAVGCAGQGPDDGTTDVDSDQSEDGLIVEGASGQPLPCADPTVVSDKNREQTWYVYCTGISHVYRTTDWKHFTDVRASVTFALGGLPDAGRAIRSWWAPSVTYDPAHDRYVMWVSVVDASASDARSLAVLTAPGPMGPWTYRRLGRNASQNGQMYIDPFLFRGHGGASYLFWKQYGGGLSSSLMGARLDANETTIVAGTAHEMLNGYGGPGTWEDNCRENPTVWQDTANGTWHMLFSGASWHEGTYATGHAISNCGPLCTGSSGWRPRSSGDRGVVEVVQARNLKAFDDGGPGGAEWQGRDGKHIVYAAAAHSKQGDTTRYLFRDRVRWANGAPYVNNTKHNPMGF